MTKKTKGRSGCNQATSNTTKTKFNYNCIAHAVKATFITLAIWRCFPLCWAKWINKLGEHDD